VGREESSSFSSGGQAGGSSQVTPSNQQSQAEAEDELRRDGGQPHEEIRRRIELRAYALYEAGGYQEGRALEHWLEAERQVASEEEPHH
jgi:hypothetical protein